MEVSAAQVHWFRLRRSGLVDPFATVEETARRMIGVQAQLPQAAGLALMNRTVSCREEEVDEARLQRKSLVRFWGQRNTVHMYATEDWPFLYRILAERESMLRKRLEKEGLWGEFRSVVRRIGKRLASGQRLTYKDIKAKKLQESQNTWAVQYVVLMQLVREGIVCHGPDDGAESTFVHRDHWLPDLAWDPPEQTTAYAELARRYFGAYGPAEVADLAFWYGTSLTKARQWVAAAGDAIGSVRLGGEDLLIDESDRSEIARKPPPPSRWPVHLLYRFDPILLATKDKSWLVDAEHYKAVWKPSAHVDPVLLVRGRIAGTWRYDRKARGLHVTVKPFGKLPSTVKKAAEKRAAASAAFLGLELGAFEVVD